MRTFLLSALVAACFFCGQARCEPSLAEANEGLGLTASENRLSSHLGNPVAGAYRRHASLALFSLGSLAVGGVFYGIDASLDKGNVEYTAGDRTRMSTAAGAAAFTALIAAGSYFYFVRQDVRRAREWDAGLSAGPASGGGMAFAASIRLPMP